MNKIPPGFLQPSAALVLKQRQVRFFGRSEKRPEVGDVVYGRVERIGQHSEIENKLGRIHRIDAGSRSIFVFGNRYAPDYYEAFVPERLNPVVDLVSRSGIVSAVEAKNSQVKDPTRVEVLGYVYGEDDKVLNTREFPLIVPKTQERKPNRAKLILVVGTSMNSGKSMSAIACCWALSAMGHSVRASKLTGTASLKEILFMQDAGAEVVNDFTHFGCPSTYMMKEDEILNIFDQVDLKYGNDPKNYWIVELADGILQRETAMLLRSEVVRDRIHRLIFAASDCFGALGGLRLLKDEFGLTADAISGVCSGSPLAQRELSRFVSTPVFNNMDRNLEQLAGILL